MLLSKFKHLVIVTALILSLSTITFASAGHGHEGDIIVGQTSGGALAFEGDFDEDIVLPSSSNPFFPGYLDDAPGFTNLDADEPLEDFYTLPVNSDIYLQLVSTDFGLVIRDELGNAINPGQSIQLGTPNFDEHGLFHIDTTLVPAYDGEVLSATFFLKDLGASGLGDSGQFTMTFVPEPATMLLLGCGSMALIRRKKANIG